MTATCRASPPTRWPGSRPVTYRLARIRELTGRDPGQPADALALHVAVIGARVLDWPATRLERA